MASYCPKCGYKLKITDIKPNCPKCGVNVMYYKMDERLLADADRVEEEHVHFQKKIDRLKASFFGSKLAIVRFVFCFLPIGALFLPLAKVTLDAPFISENSTVNALFLYNFISKLDFGALFEYIGSDVLGTEFIQYLLALVFTLLSVVMVLLNLILLLLSCSPHGKSRNIIIDSAGIVFSVLGIVFFNMFSGSIAAVFPGAYSGSLSFGAIIYVLTFVALLVINIIIAKVGVPVEYKQCYISGFTAEEVFSAREKGITLDQMRAERDAKEAAEAEKLTSEKVEAPAKA